MELFTAGTNILMIIIGFGVLIFVHELGHFVAAKWAGIRTEGFAIGFGPVACSWRKGIGLRIGSTNRDVVSRMGRPAITCSSQELAEAGIGETEYSLRVLPLGGFVRMLGQDDVDPSATSTDPNSYNSKSIGKRMVVVSAGIVMNLILAVVFFLAAFLVGVKFNAPVVGEVLTNMPAANAGIRPGETIVSVDGEPTRTFADIQIAFAMASPGTELQAVVHDDETDQNRTVGITPEQNAMTGLLGIGITPGSSATLASSPEIDPLIEAELNAVGIGDSGVGPGWSIRRIGDSEVSTWDQWAAAVDAADGKLLETHWEGPDGQEVATTLPATPLLEIMRYPNEMPETVPNYEEGLLGLSPLVSIESVSPDSLNQDVLLPGDVVLRVGDVDGPRSAVFRQLIQEAAGKQVTLLVLREGERVEVTGSVNQSGQLGVLILPALGESIIATPFLELGSSIVGDAPTRSPVADLGLLPLTRITAVNGASVDDWAALRAAMRKATDKAASDELGATLTLGIENPTPGRERQDVTLELDTEEVRTLHALGWAPPISNRYFEFLWTTLSADGDPLKAIGMGFEETRKVVTLTYLTIFRLAQGSVSVKQLRGPVGIVHLGSRVADRGFMYLVFFLAMISVNLAVLNFLPLPIVDGGLFLYLVYEKFKGRPPSVGFQNIAALFGLMAIGTIFLVTFYNDVMRLIG
ncbi:MAG: site-2 protease family protein [Phycisphaerales bacterium]|nr:site-2 protease family protein [Phycisphaerales bacterium]